LREIPIQFGWRERRYLGFNLTLCLALPLVGNEKEKAVLALQEMGEGNGPAKRTTELVAFQISPRKAFLNVEISVGIKIGVSHKFEGAAMDSVGA
jgi:hypothetical protein